MNLPAGCISSVASPAFSRSPSPWPWPSPLASWDLPTKRLSLHNYTCSPAGQPLSSPPLQFFYFVGEKVEGVFLGPRKHADLAGTPSCICYLEISCSGRSGGGRRNLGEESEESVHS